jgi:hydrogenase nickel incorporation protein HypB
MCAICGCNNHDEAGALHTADRQGQGQGQGAGELDAPLAQEGADQHLHFGAGAAGLSVPGTSATRIIKLEANILGANQRFADANRRHFAAHGVAAYNLVSSPGSGKTTVLCATITALHQRSPERPLAVIEGDQQTDLDTQRIRATGAQAIQINTGRGCHLDARMVGEAFSRLDLHAHSHATVHEQARCDDTTHDTGRGSGALLLIENVGNLVCPALWDLGENAKVALLSVTEGDDKPMKYPDMFAAASLMLINKIDLLPYVDFNVERCVSNARRINPDIAVVQISATRGDGMDAWLDWLQATTC